MAHGLALDSRDLALDLYRLLRELDPVRWRDELAEAAAARVAEIKARLERLLAATWPSGLAIRERLAELQRLVERYAPHNGGDLREQWMAFRAELQPAYEALAASLKEWDVHVPSLRPTNYSRNLFHVAGACFVIALVVLWANTPPRMMGLAFGAAALAWAFEITRRRWPGWNDVLMRAFGPTSHPHERHRVNSATWYVTALALLSLTHSPIVGTVAVAVLGFADPAAALIGRRFGRVKLLHGRTLEGSLAFVLVAATTVTLLLVAVYGMGLPAALPVAGIAATAGAVAEMFARRVDDNLTIPLAAGASAWLVLLA